MASFLIAIPFIFANEGGLEKNVNDTRGITNYGITRSILQKSRNKPVDATDIINLSQEEAKEIYKKYYWDGSGIEALTNQDLATSVLDMCVLTGTDTAIPNLQIAYNNLPAIHKYHTLKIDGKLGPNSIKAINEASPIEILTSYKKVMTKYFIRCSIENPSQEVFLKGWINRLNKNYS